MGPFAPALALRRRACGAHLLVRAVELLETWVSGSAFGADYARATGQKLAGDVIVARPATARPRPRRRWIATATPGPALAVICDILDPNVIVFGGGMSNVTELYDRVPPIVARYAFSDVFVTEIRPALYGDSSGVRGAAWLWPLET